MIEINSRQRDLGMMGQQKKKGASIIQQSLSGELASVRDWILSRRENVVELDLDTDLIDTRIIDSLDFAEFLFVLEELTGTPIEIEEVDIDAFRTLRVIEARFLRQGQVHACG